MGIREIVIVEIMFSYVLKKKIVNIPSANITIPPIFGLYKDNTKIPMKMNEGIR